jgi:hypothetical protein
MALIPGNDAVLILTDGGDGARTLSSYVKKITMNFKARTLVDTTCMGDAGRTWTPDDLEDGTFTVDFFVDDGTNTVWTTLFDATVGLRSATAAKAFEIGRVLLFPAGRHRHRLELRGRQGEAHQGQPQEHPRTAERPPGRNRDQDTGGVRGAPFSEQKTLDRAIIVGDREPPIEYVEAELCRLFHCLPSQLESEPADVIRYAAWLMHADSVRAKEAQRQVNRHGKR